MEVLIDSSTKVVDSLPAKIEVQNNALNMEVENNDSYELSKLLVIARKESIIWSRDLSEEEKSGFFIRENFYSFVCECRSKLKYNYRIAVELAYKNGQKAIAFIADPKGKGKADKGGMLDRRKTARRPIVIKDTERVNGETFSELVVMIFAEDATKELLLRASKPDLMMESFIRGNTRSVKLSKGKVRLELELPPLQEDLKSIQFCRLKEETYYEMDFSVDKQKSKWIIKASIDLNQIEISRPFWMIYAETTIFDHTVLIPFSIGPKLSRKIRIFAPHAVLKNGNICYVKQTKKKTLQLVIREKMKYDSYLIKVKEAFAIAEYLITKKKARKRTVWLVFEKFCSTAQDNGLAFFTYCMENLSPEEKKDIYFIIEKDAPAYQKLKKYGRNVVPFMSLKHMYLCLFAKMCVASESKRHLYPWRGKPSIIENRLRKIPIFFLQHGVTAFKRVDSVFGKSGTDPMTYFVATSQLEQSIVVDNFGYDPKNVPILGFARWDQLEDTSTEDNKMILVMPTWRKWLQDMDSDEFQESDYFRLYSSLLTSDKLNEVLRAQKTRLIFYIHPKFKEYTENFSVDEDYVSLIPFGEQPLNELLRECKMLITDYSSVAWDFYYMKKPVIFYQFDYEQYMIEHGSYIDMTTQLFGDRIVEHEDLVNCICSYVDSGFEEKEQFTRMRSQMFKYNDRNNCKRTYDFVRGKGAKKDKSAIRGAYMEHYHNDPIDDSLVLLESQNGKKIDGSIYYILQELLSDERYDKYRICLSAEDEEARDLVLRKIGHHDRVEVVVTESKEYYQILATAKYLINDATFRNSFIKKDGQKYLNLWHGTPLKNMGRKAESDPDESGNVTKNFICADYLLYPNEYTRKHMVEDYMIENLSDATILYCGYPRNTAFFDDEMARSIRVKENLEGKRVYVYMPTWRKDAGDAFQNILMEIDQKLSDQEVMYAKMHPLADSVVNYNGFKHIRKFPDEYEAYEFLNAADCLITDYSSVMFDFAVTGRKTVLFTFDEKEYLKERGMYLSLDELPFERVYHVDELLTRIREDGTEDGLAQFRESFCAYDSRDGVKKLCEKFFLGIDQDIKEEQLQHNGKENVFVFAGNISDPEVEEKVIPYLSELKKTGKNIFLTYKRKEVIHKAGILHRLPEDIGHFGMPGPMNLTKQQRSAKKKYEKGEMPFEQFWQVCKGAYEDELKRNHGGVRIDEVIMFDSIDEKMLLEYSLVDCKRHVILGEEWKQFLNAFDADYKSYIDSKYELKFI